MSSRLRREGARAAGWVPFTARARDVLEATAEEAEAMLHGCVGTEHLLFGILRTKDSVASHVLEDMGVTLKKCRDEIIAVAEDGGGGWT